MFIQERLKEISPQLHWKEREKAVSLIEEKATDILTAFSYLTKK